MIIWLIGIPSTYIFLKIISRKEKKDWTQIQLFIIISILWPIFLTGFLINLIFKKIPEDPPKWL